MTCRRPEPPRFHISTGDRPLTRAEYEQAVLDTASHFGQYPLSPDEIAALLPQEMPMLVAIGNVMIYPTGTNPYHQPYNTSIPRAKRVPNPYCTGQPRARVLRQYRDTGVLPEGYSLWNHYDKCDITDRSQIAWVGLRED